MSDDPNAPATGSDPPPPPADPAPEPPQEPDNGQTPEPEPAAQQSSSMRPYGVYTERVLDVKGVADQKAAGAALAELATEGKVAVLVRQASVVQSDPKRALMAVGEVRDLEGDYEVIAESARNKFAGVKSATKRVVEIG